MKANMGFTDRIVRILGAALVTVLVYLNIIQGVTAIVLLLLSAVFVITSIFGICPLYGLFGINTNSSKEAV